MFTGKLRRPGEVTFQHHGSEERGVSQARAAPPPTLPSATIYTAPSHREREISYANAPRTQFTAPGRGPPLNAQAAAGSPGPAEVYYAPSGGSAPLGAASAYPWQQQQQHHVGSLARGKRSVSFDREQQGSPLPRGDHRAAVAGASVTSPPPREYAPINPEPVFVALSHRSGPLGGVGGGGPPLLRDQLQPRPISPTDIYTAPQHNPLDYIGYRGGGNDGFVRGVEDSTLTVVGNTLVRLPRHRAGDDATYPVRRAEEETGLLHRATEDLYVTVDRLSRQVERLHDGFDAAVSQQRDGRRGAPLTDGGDIETSGTADGFSSPQPLRATAGVPPTAGGGYDADADDATKPLDADVDDMVKRLAAIERRFGDALHADETERTLSARGSARDSAVGPPAAAFMPPPPASTAAALRSTPLASTTASSTHSFPGGTSAQVSRSGSAGDLGGAPATTSAASSATSSATHASSLHNALLHRPASLRLLETFMSPRIEIVAPTPNDQSTAGRAEAAPSTSQKKTSHDMALSPMPQRSTPATSAFGTMDGLAPPSRHDMAVSPMAAKTPHPVVQPLTAPSARHDMAVSPMAQYHRNSSHEIALSPMAIRGSSAADTSTTAAPSSRSVHSVGVSPRPQSEPAAAPPKAPGHDMAVGMTPRPPPASSAFATQADAPPITGVLVSPPSPKASNRTTPEPPPSASPLSPQSPTALRKSRAKLRIEMLALVEQEREARSRIESLEAHYSSHELSERHRQLRKQYHDEQQRAEERLKRLEEQVAHHLANRDRGERIRQQNISEICQELSTLDQVSNERSRQLQQHVSPSPYGWQSNAPVTLTTTVMRENDAAGGYLMGDPHDPTEGGSRSFLAAAGREFGERIQHSSPARASRELSGQRPSPNPHIGGGRSPFSNPPGGGQPPPGRAPTMAGASSIGRGVAAFGTTPGSASHVVVDTTPPSGNTSSRSVRFVMTSEQERAALETEQQISIHLAAEARRRYKQDMMNRLLSTPLSTVAAGGGL